MTEMS